MAAVRRASLENSDNIKIQINAYSYHHKVFKHEEEELKDSFTICQARIAAIINYLRMRGFPLERVQSFNFGKNEPIGNEVIIKVLFSPSLEN